MKSMLLNALGFTGQDPVSVRLAIPAIWAEKQMAAPVPSKKELKQLYQSDLESYLDEVKPPSSLA